MSPRSQPVITPIASFAAGRSPGEQVTFLADSKQIAYVHPTAGVVVVEADTGRVIHPVGHSSNSDAIAVSPDGRFIAAVGTVSQEDRVVLWNIATSEPAATFSQPFAVNAIAFSPDNRFLAVAGDNPGFLMSFYGVIQVWELASGKEVAHITIASGPAFSLAFSPSGAVLAAGTGNRLQQFGIHGSAKIRLIDVASGKVSKTVDAHDGAVRSVAFSHDGTYLASGGSDGECKIWEAKSLKLRTKLLAHGAGHDVRNIIFSNDDSLIFTAAWTDVKVWDVPSSQEVKDCFDPSKACYPVSLDVTGKRIVTGNHQSGLSMWAIEYK